MSDLLYELLPAVYRERDAEEGYPLRALLRIVGEQAELLEQDVEALWNDLFVETCRTWAIPYIGDLVSNDLLFDAGRVRDDATALRLFTDLTGPDLRAPVAVRTRADVAKTVYYRRRKGTVPMLEELARDVTGWPAHAVEFFELLGWTQHLEHVRSRCGWFDVRSVERNGRVDGAFDEASHTVDVRPISQLEGWHSIRNVGFFLWRLGAYPLENVPARRAGPDWRWHFSPLGNAAPLFSRWRREGDEAGLATELHVAAPIRRALFHDDLERHATVPPPDSTDLYGAFEPLPGITPCPECSLFVVRNGLPVAPAQVVCRRLDPWPAAPPTGAVVAIDVVAGRIAVGDGWGDATDAVDTSFHYGFPADLGGGPYERRRWLVSRDLPHARYRVKEDGVAPPGTDPVTHTSVAAALAEWASPSTGRPDAVIEILDSRTYALPGSIVLSDLARLAIEAANGQRPLLRTPAAGLELSADASVPADPDLRGGLTLGGVVVEGFVHVTGDVGRLRLLHSTLVPGRRLTQEGEPATADPSIVVEGTAGAQRINARLRVEAAFSVLGPIAAPEHVERVTLLDTIVDGLGGDALAPAGAGFGPPLEVERSTLLGPVRVRELEASETIFTGEVRTERTQGGCVRFSYVPPGSRTPRRYRCQPDLAVERALEEALEADPALTAAEQDALRAFVRGRVVPAFTADRYGHPAYAQLRLSVPVEIRTGAEDGAEMGVYCHLKQPQRESNLRIRLEEYLPFGLDAGVIYVT